jgi:DNA-binding NarL/FixJ family response regulator
LPALHKIDVVNLIEDAMSPLPQNLLIVEDSPLIQDRLVRLFDDVPEVRVVAVAPSQEEAVRRIGSDRPDLLLLDIALASGDGFHVLRHLKEGEVGQRVVMLTNYANALFRQRARHLGVRHFFDKSTEFDRAIDCMRQLAVRLGSSGIM